MSRRSRSVLGAKAGEAQQESKDESRHGKTGTTAGHRDSGGGFSNTRVHPLHNRVHGAHARLREPKDGEAHAWASGSLKDHFTSRPLLRPL